MHVIIATWRRNWILFSVWNVMYINFIIMDGGEGVDWEDAYQRLFVSKVREHPIPVNVERAGGHDM